MDAWIDVACHACFVYQNTWINSHTLEGLHCDLLWAAIILYSTIPLTYILDPGWTPLSGLASQSYIKSKRVHQSNIFVLLSCYSVLSHTESGCHFRASSSSGDETTSLSILLSSLHPLSSVTGVKSSLLSSHQSAGIWSMPRSLCAAKQQIKEAVISSPASATDSCIAVQSGWWSWEGFTLQQRMSKGRIWQGGMGRRRGRKGQQTVGQCCDTRFYSCREPSGEWTLGGGGGMTRWGKLQTIKGRQRLQGEEV